MSPSRLVPVTLALLSALLFTGCGPDPDPPITVARTVKGAAGGGAALDPELKDYVRVNGISGTLNSVGSDTLNNKMTFWRDVFVSYYPSVRIQIEGKGSSTAPIALIEGISQLGPMSRRMKPSEIDAFERRFGYPPTRVPVAIDGMALFVNKDHPLEKLSLPQVDAIFSSTREGGYPRDIATWAELGISELGPRAISLYGRNAASGTYGFFKQVALYKGDFKNSVKEQPGSASVVQGIAEDPYGIGYSGIGYKTAGVKILSLELDDGSTLSPEKAEDVYGGRYPLSRFLYVYVNRPPDRPLPPAVAEFLRFILSRQGQEVVLKDNYLPLTAEMVERFRRELGLE